MMLASVSKLNIHVGDPVYDRIKNDIDAAQEDGSQFFLLDAYRLEVEIRMDLIVALTDLGYDAEYDADADNIEVAIRE